MRDDAIKEVKNLKETFIPDFECADCGELMVEDITKWMTYLEHDKARFVRHWFCPMCEMFEGARGVH